MRCEESVQQKGVERLDSGLFRCRKGRVGDWHGGGENRPGRNYPRQTLRANILTRAAESHRTATEDLL